MLTIDPGAVAGLVADDRQRLVVGVVVGDQEVERDALLREDAAERIGQVSGAVVGRDGDGQSRADAGRASLRPLRRS